MCLRADYVTPVADGDDTLAADSVSAVAKTRSSSSGGHRKRRGRRRSSAVVPTDAAAGALACESWHSICAEKLSHKLLLPIAN